MHSGLERGGTQNRVGWTGPLKSGRRSRRLIIFSVIGLAALALIVAVVIWRHGKTTQAAGPPMVPVTVAEAAQHDVPIYYDALGTVPAYNTVAIRAQVTGQLISVDFRQGQEVRQGDVLAKIDPAPLKAVLDQAVAKKADDQAQLVSAQKDFSAVHDAGDQEFRDPAERRPAASQGRSFQGLDRRRSGRHRGGADPARLCDDHGADRWRRRLSPGRRRQHHPHHRPQSAHGADPDQAVHVIFTLPQSDLGPVREAMLRGTVSVLAFDQNDKEQLAEGRLLLIDNQIDQTTSTIRLKAEFPNEDERLWPGEFVRIRILITTNKDAVTVPPVAVQRGPDGFYVWVVKPDNTVEQRPIGAQMVNDDDGDRHQRPRRRRACRHQRAIAARRRLACRHQTSNPPPAAAVAQQQADKN